LTELQAAQLLLHVGSEGVKSRERLKAADLQLTKGEDLNMPGAGDTESIVKTDGTSSNPCGDLARLRVEIASLIFILCGRRQRAH
jgi:hypothetical protein